MAAISLAYLGGGQLTGSAATYVTAGTAQNLVIKKAVFTNTDAATRTITVYRVASGGSAGATNTIFAAFPLSAGQTYEATALGNMVLSPGASLQAFADTTAKVNMFVSGLAQ